MRLPSGFSLGTPCHFIKTKFFDPRQPISRCMGGGQPRRAGHSLLLVRSTDNGWRGPDTLRLTAWQYMQEHPARTLLKYCRRTNDSPSRSISTTNRSARAKNHRSQRCMASRALLRSRRVLSKNVRSHPPSRGLHLNSVSHTPNGLLGPTRMCDANSRPWRLERRCSGKSATSCSPSHSL